MGEVAATVAAVRYVYPIYQACDKLYNGIQATRTFGDEYGRAKRRFEAQYARLDSTAEKYLHSLEEPIDPNDEDQEAARRVVGVLSDIRTTLEKCDQLVKGECSEYDSFSSTSFATIFIKTSDGLYCKPTMLEMLRADSRDT
jgi:Prion-inhibition and propagation